MAGVQIGNLAGLGYVQFWKVDEDGYAMGQVADPDAPGTDTTTHAYLCRHPVNFSPAAPSRANVDFVSAGSWDGSMLLGLDSMGLSTIRMSVLDAALLALAEGSTVDTTSNSYWAQFAANLREIDLPLMGMMLSVRIQSRTSGSDGVNKWVNRCYPRIQLAVKEPEADHLAAAELEFDITHSMSDKRPSGETLVALGLEDDRAPMYYISADKPVGVSTYVSNGIATSFIAGYRPLSDVVAVNATPNHFCINGTPTALDSIVPATGVATLAAAGNSGDINVLMYETGFKAI